MLCKTEWSWELRTWSHTMNLLDILSTSPHNPCRKWTGVTNENSNFDLRVQGFNIAHLVSSLACSELASPRPFSRWPPTKLRENMTSYPPLPSFYPSMRLTLAPFCCPEKSGPDPKNWTLSRWVDHGVEPQAYVNLWKPMEALITLSQRGFY